MFTDSKTILQEVIQRDFRSSDIQYCVTNETGPDHNKNFTVALMMDGVELGSGSGSTKKAAEQEAAYRSLIELKKRGVRV